MSSGPRYAIRIKRSAEKEMDRLSTAVFQRITKALLALEDEPRPRGCRKLRGSEQYRLRVGDYRVLSIPSRIKTESLRLSPLEIDAMYIDKTLGAPRIEIVCRASTTYSPTFAAKTARPSCLSSRPAILTSTSPSK